MVVCEDGAIEETIRKHYGDILADPEISSLDRSRLVREVFDTAPTRILELPDTETTNPFVIAFPDGVVWLESHIWRVTSVPQP